MQNTSMAGVPINCINWLALGAVVYGAMEKKKALRVLGLKEQYKTNDLIKYAEVKALVNKGDKLQRNSRRVRGKLINI